MTQPITITVLVENSSSRRDLEAEHGLSLWIEADGLRILFDTGQSAAFLANAGRLGVPLSDVDALVLSHGHYDHSGGLAVVRPDFEPSRVYLHPSAVLPKYRQCDRPPHKYIGMPPASAAVIERMRDRVTWTNAPTRISERVFVTGAIPRTSGFEDVGGPFFEEPECSKPDLMSDDQSLWIDTPEGLVICAGCCHAGLVNTLDYIRKVSGKSAVRAIIGGFHLVNASPDRLERTVEAVRQAEPGVIAACHCTGESAVDALKAAFGARMSLCSGGTRYIFSNSGVSA